jgi:hypothetical protein
LVGLKEDLPSEKEAASMSNPNVYQAISHVRSKSDGPCLAEALPLTMNFHPDAPYAGGYMIESLATTGVYRSQFETGTSNGGLTAHVGGDRWNWESRIFGNAYDHAPPADRPKYGALNYQRNATGGSPRFGSCHIRLKSHVLSRATFCYPDSHFNPVHFGVADRMALIGMIETMPAQNDPLDRYIEAHIHGQIDMTEDVEAIVLDPSYRGSDIERITSSIGCLVEWHSGYSLDVNLIPECVSYRGHGVAELALALSQNGYLTPRVIGVAVSETRAERQLLKQVWHCVARFGAPSDR